tara:strand:+ start:235 stop:549 length:315 start_codon:yes stop_codon:yes gene_type:complete
VSKVSVSLTAGIPVLEHFVIFQSLFSSRGLPEPENFTFSGSLIGSSFSSTGKISPSFRYIIGIGHPQYLCLETPQSLSLNLVVCFPIFDFSKTELIFFFGLFDI